MGLRRWCGWASGIGRGAERLAATGLFALASLSVRAFGVSAAYWYTRRLKPLGKGGRSAPADVSRLVTLVDGGAQLLHHASWCLSRSLALTLMLRLRGIPARLVLGVRPVPLMGHAWVEVSGEVVNDDPKVLKFYQRLDEL